MLGAYLCVQALSQEAAGIHILCWQPTVAAAEGWSERPRAGTLGGQTSVFEVVLLFSNHSTPTSGARGPFPSRCWASPLWIPRGETSRLCRTGPRGLSSHRCPLRTEGSVPSARSTGAFGASSELPNNPGLLRALDPPKS